MIFLRLFFTFFKIGAFSFGGGYAIISIIRDTMLSNGWMSEETLIDIIAVAESTPGPIAINMATFVGAKEGGFLGSLCATLGMILPSFLCDNPYHCRADIGTYEIFRSQSVYRWCQTLYYRYDIIDRCDYGTFGAFLVHRH